VLDKFVRYNALALFGSLGMRSHHLRPLYEILGIFAQQKLDSEIRVVTKKDKRAEAKLSGRSCTM